MSTGTVPTHTYLWKDRSGKLGFDSEDQGRGLYEDFKKVAFKNE